MDWGKVISPPAPKATKDDFLDKIPAIELMGLVFHKVIVFG